MFQKILQLIIPKKTGLKGVAIFFFFFFFFFFVNFNPVDTNSILVDIHKYLMKRL